MKHNIVISLHSQMYRSLFYETGSFSELERCFDVTYLQEDPLKKLKSISGSIGIGSPKKYKRNLTNFLDQYSYLSMWRYRDRSKSFVLKFGNYINSVSRGRRLVIKLLALPVLFEIFDFFFKKIFFPTHETLKILHDLKPALLVVVSNGTSDGISMDLLAAADKLGIQSLFLMYNWDNVTCKGVYPFKPTYAGVWGEQSAEHFTRIHKLRASSIFILGSPQFSVYERLESSKLQNIREVFGIPCDQLLGAYLGGARYRDDILLLKTLDPILKRHNLYLVYRPHPFQDRDMVLAGDYYGEKFTNIFMDPAIADHYKHCRHDPEYNIKSISYKYDRFADFLSSLDFVISSYSTMSIESMIMGKPVLLTAYPDHTFQYSFDKIKMYEHHNCWPKFTDIVICDNIENIESDIKKVVSLARDPLVCERLKKQVGFVSYSDSNTYSTRLLSCINTLLRT